MRTTATYNGNNITEINKELCNAIGCSKIATKSLDLGAGNFGNIRLNFCKDCIPKFETKGRKIKA